MRFTVSDEFWFSFNLYFRFRDRCVRVCYTGKLIKWQVLLLLLISRFSSCLWISAFYYDSSICGSPVCIPFGVHWTSWKSRLMFFSKSGNFSAIISSNIFSAFSLPSSSVSCHTYGGMPPIFLRFCSFFFILFSVFWIK